MTESARPPLESAVGDLLLAFQGAAPVHQLLEHVPLGDGAGLVRSVLEPGCGSGKLSLHLALLGCDVTALDLDPDMVDYAGHLAEAAREVLRAAGQGEAATRLQHVATTGDMHALALPSEAYDLVFNEGSCVPPGTLINTGRGLRPIENVSVGDSVLTHRGRYRRVLHHSIRPYRGEIMSLCSGVASRRAVQGLPQLLAATPEHPILTSKGGWVEALDFDGNFSVLPALQTTIDIPEVVVAWKARMGTRDGRVIQAHPFEQKLSLTPSLMALVGYYLSEGYVSGQQAGRTDRVYFCFGKSQDEAWLAEDAARKASDLGLTAKVNANHHGCHQVVIYNAGLARWLSTTFGKGAANKTVPPHILQLPGAKLEAMVKSYFSGDGYHPEHRANLWRANTVSQMLAYGIRDACLRLEWSATVISQRTGKGRPQYAILANKHGGRAGMLRFTDGALERLVTAQRMPYVGLVHNIEVEEDNSYCTSEMAIHNCEHWPKDEQVQVVREMARVSKAWVAFFVPDAAHPESQRVAREVHHHYKGMPEHESPLTRAECEALVRDAGLHLRAIEPSMERFHFVLAHKHPTTTDDAPAPSVAPKPGQAATMPQGQSISLEALRGGRP